MSGIDPYTLSCLQQNYSSDPLSAEQLAVRGGPAAHCDRASARPPFSYIPFFSLMWMNRLRGPSFVFPNGLPSLMRRS